MKITTEISSDGQVVAKPLFDTPKDMKAKPRIRLSFTNGIPKQYEDAKGFESELEGGYDQCIALIDELRKALVMFRNEDARRKSP